MLGITAYLRRERDALKGCPVADVMADPELRRPVEETFAWLTDRLAGLLAEGHANDELDAGLDSAATATALVAVLQGGYVLPRRRIVKTTDVHPLVTGDEPLIQPL